MDLSSFPLFRQVGATKYIPEFGSVHVDCLLGKIKGITYRGGTGPILLTTKRPPDEQTLIATVEVLRNRADLGSTMAQNSSAVRCEANA